VKLLRSAPFWPCLPLLVAICLVPVAGYCGSVDDGSDPAATLESITVIPPVVSIAVGATQQFVALGTYSNGHKKNITSSVTWKSSNHRRYHQQYRPSHRSCRWPS
jgi:hypothetical protein